MDGSAPKDGKGWLTAPFLIESTNRAFSVKNPVMNISFRFGVRKGEKLRACDDLRHSAANLSCAVETPTKLVSRGHLSELCRRVELPGRDWRFMKADPADSYKQLPLAWEHSRMAVVALKSPMDVRRRGFFSRTLLFDAMDAVLHYNVFSRILAELFTRLSAFPY